MGRESFPVCGFLPTPTTIRKEMKMSKRGRKKKQIGKIIFPITKANPYRPKSRRYFSFSLIKPGGTSFEEFDQAGGNSQDLNRAIRGGHLEVRDGRDAA